MEDFIGKVDSLVDSGLEWLNDNATTTFDFARAILDGAFHGIQAVLNIAPWWLLVLIVLVVGWLAVSRSFAVFAAAGLGLCAAMGLWSATMSTLALVLSSTLLALLIAVPAGIVVGLKAGLSKSVDVVLDFIQTMPPYIFLLPGIALLGYGPATAMCATCLVAIPPALRLTAHGIRMTPTEQRELGIATGMKPLQVLSKIRIPFALPSILAGVNQSLMLAFGMVVIAGIAGSGGLGQDIYESVRLLKIDKAINAGIAIVILTIVLDRFSQRLGGRSPKES